MAVVKIRFNKDARKTIAYAFDERSPGDPVDAVGCPADRDGAATEFELVRAMHNFKGGNEAVHIVQSWSPEESKRLSREDVNGMGKKLVEEYFRGHPFVVVTHSDGAHLHNHIVVSTVHRETGRRIPNKKLHLYKLREINDSICLARGLFARVLALRPQAILLVHNHPSGIAVPSSDDRSLSSAVGEVLSRVGIRFLGHWIVTSGTETEVR